MLVAAGLASTSAFAADMAVKAPPAPAAPAASPWDIYITTGLMTDYNFRGVSQSGHKPSVQGGFEPRYNLTKDLQLYFGVSGESIDFPNRAASETDFYAGFRPTFDKLALDFGFWEYYYPGGQCFNTAALCNAFGGGPSVAATLPINAASPLGGNTVKQNVSFYEVYGKATYTVNDNFNFGGSVWYSPSVLNTGARGIYYAGNVTLTAPSTWLPSGLGMYVSGDLGYWSLGTSDLFYAVPAFPAGVPYTSYATWDAGIAFTYKALTLDFRYYDTNLSKSQCNVFTSDHTATFSPGNITAQNPNGLGSTWCSSALVAKLSFATNLSGIK
jgi:uncharacterized protein (TIGR02001 family)